MNSATLCSWLRLWILEAVAALRIPSRKQQILVLFVWILLSNVSENGWQMLHFVALF